MTRDGWNLVVERRGVVRADPSQVGPDGAVWVDDLYNFIAQHNPTPTRGYSNGRGDAYETSMRDHVARPHLSHRLQGRAGAEEAVARRRATRAGLLEALGSDNMFWRLTAQRLLVERGQKDVVPQLLALVRNTAVDAIGVNGGAMHALWTLQGLGELNATTTEAYRAAVGALKHPSAAVRKAAAMVLPKRPEAATAIIDAGLLQDPELHTRLAATLVIAEMPASLQIGAGALQGSAEAGELQRSVARPRALHRGDEAPGARSSTRYNADPAKLPFAALSVPLRMGDATPDWRVPRPPDRGRRGRTCRLPGNWESRACRTSTGSSGSRETSMCRQGDVPTRCRSDRCATRRVCG